jgi:hypothetical protein
MGLKLNIPDHSHISRRAKTLSVVIPCRVHNEPLHVVIDFTGLKVYGEGEWKVRLFESQVTEVLMRIAAMNIMTALGMPFSVRLGTVAP